MRVFLVLALVLGLAFLFQTAVVSRINLLSGSADLPLVILAAWSLQERVRFAWVWGALAGGLVGVVSGVPWFLFLAAYLSVVGLARLLSRRIWQAPLLAMFAITLIGTFILHMSIFFYRTLFDTPLAFGSVFPEVVLPSLLLNLLFAVAVHPLMRDMAERLYPAEATA